MISDKLYINLTILSKIQKNGRITRSYDGMIALEQDSFYQPLKRFVSHDSRKQSVFEINSIIIECIDTLYSLINSKFMNKMYSDTDEFYKNYEDLVLLSTQLENSKMGIENLKFTYSNDPNTESQLDILLLKINSTLKDIKYKISNLKLLLPVYKQDVIPEKNTHMHTYTHTNISEKEKIVPQKLETIDSIVLDMETIDSSYNNNNNTNNTNNNNNTNNTNNNNKQSNQKQNQSNHKLNI